MNNKIDQRILLTNEHWDFFLKMIGHFDSVNYPTENYDILFKWEASDVLYIKITHRKTGDIEGDIFRKNKIGKWCIMPKLRTALRELWKRQQLELSK